MRLAVISFAAFSLAACVGTPPVERVASEVEALGACKALPEGVTCECVTTTAHTLIPTMKYERDKDDTGSRLGRGKIGGGDPRIPPAIEAAKQSCAAGKAVV
ncbi:MAG TPA: hypothetical protein VG942_11795 [Hyphomonadaceae bacterium]|nr:hypothetical protein [Hyphomonadaceae bacterium]